MKALQRAWPLFAVTLLYAGAALKFGLSVTSDSPSVPEWVWVNSVVIPLIEL